MGAEGAVNILYRKRARRPPRTARPRPTSWSRSTAPSSPRPTCRPRAATSPT
ncbi:MAG: hypothetical protein MZW92_41585 [Comamonadaceae bacterium]|nr:hypothetical protein [Comamonadaceae bacterium]